VSVSVLNLEHQLDMQLARPHVTAETSPAMLIAAARWSAAIWAAAEVAGPIELGKAEVLRGLGVAHRPVFVCGVHRSGTTLVRDLLDSHPALAVLPSEGTFFTNFERHLQRLRPERWLPFLGCEWVRRLANPIHQHPYWLLGRSSQESSPYVTFARALMAWWPYAQERVGHNASSWPLVAVALAYAHCTGGFSARSTLQRWAEKTPTNERFLDRLRSEFPDSKVIHVVRHPFAVYASHKKAAQTAGERFRNASRVLEELNLSYRMAAEQSRGGRSHQYLLISYEDLLESTRSTVDQLAAFLRIEPHPILMQPTAAGLPAASNSSFAIGAAAGRVHSVVHRKWTDTLTRSDRARLTAVVGDTAASLGYDLTPVAPWRAQLLRVATRITRKLP
jgi:hypothetical protein